MNPDFGFADYVPGGQFSFPRSYITKITANFTGGTVAYLAGLMTFIYPLADPVIELVLFRDYFHPWSSNCYTLDGIIQSVSYSFASDPFTIFPALVHVTYEIQGDPPTPQIVITPDTYGGLIIPFNLPSAPDDYWIQIPG